MNIDRSLACVLVVLVAAASPAAADWPGFRGAGSGVSDEKKIPAEWTKESVLWKIKLPGLGSSSPIITGDKVIVTCYAGYGGKLTKGFGKGGFDKGEPGGDDQKKLRLLVVCLDRHKGEVVWQKEIEPKLPEHPFTGFIREHGYASSTPVTDGERVYVFFGKTGVFAFDLGGRQLWQADVGSKTHVWGSAASPIVHKDLVIVNASIESDSLVGLDKKTGKEVWRVKELGVTWGTPLLVKTKDGQDDVVLSLPGRIVGYEPETGNALWQCEGIGTATAKHYTISSPAARGGIVYAMGLGPGFQPAALAVRAGGRGDVTKTHVLWRQNAGTGISSPVVSGEHVCWVAGVATCLRTADGKIAYQERLYDNRSEYVSPVVAGDRILALTRFDGLFVLATGGKFQKLAHYDFEGDASAFNGSPAVSDGRVYVRSNEYLYCFGRKPTPD